jgi:cytochrome bd-type quinol oxidase subunit 2
VFILGGAAYLTPSSASSVNDLQTYVIFGFVSLALGIILAFCLWRAPSRGWVGVALVLAASLCFALSDTGDSTREKSLPLMLMFFVLAPVAVVYSFRARRVAKDRIWANAAFVGSFVVGIMLLFCLAGLIYFALVLTGVLPMPK